MNERYRLGAMGSEQLLAALKGLVRRENFAMADMLAHLAELDERQLFLELGYSSLVAYCREALGFCKSSAGRRIAAARVCRRYPESFLRVANGELQLSVLSVLNSYLNGEGAAELLELCCGKSFEQVEELLAARFPRPDVRDLIRRLPEPARRGSDVGSAVDGRSESTQGELAHSQHTAGLEQTMGKRAEAAYFGEITGMDPTVGAQLAVPPQVGTQTHPIPTQDRVEPLSPGRYGVHFTADAEFRELLEEVRALASHRQPKGELLPLMKSALTAYRSELKKKRFAVGAKPRSTAASRSQDGVPASRADESQRRRKVELERTRRVSATVRRAVFERDHGNCTYIAVDGRRCGARRFLELDHVQPWALDGESTVENLRLRCRAHNQHAARVCFGVAHMRSAVGRARRKGCCCSGGADRPSCAAESAG